MGAIGAWLAINGDAIYGTRAVAPYKEGDVCLTRKGNALFAIALFDDAPPEQIVLSTHRPVPGSDVRMLGHAHPLDWRPHGDDVVIDVAPAVRQTPPCEHAWPAVLTPSPARL